MTFVSTAHKLLDPDDNEAFWLIPDHELSADDRSTLTEGGSPYGWDPNDHLLTVSTVIKLVAEARGREYQRQASKPRADVNLDTVRKLHNVAWALIRELEQVRKTGEEKLRAERKADRT